METLPPLQKCIPSLMHIEGDEVEMLEIGGTSIVKKMEEIPSDLMADLKAIFFLPLEREVTECERFMRSGKLDRFEKILELPRCLPENHDFSDNLVLVFKTFGHCDLMVFVIDWCEHTKRINLFHVVNKTRNEDVEYGSLPLDKTTGYATIGDKLYFIGGSFYDHNIKYNRYEVYKHLDLPDNVFEEMVESRSISHLSVPTYNLKTRKWESHTLNLIGPKPFPVVFVYNGNIYALAGHSRSQLHPKDPKFELLNTKNGSSQTLPPPPFLMEFYSHHFLDHTNGLFYLFFTRYNCSYQSEDEDDDEDEGYDDDDDDEEEEEENSDEEEEENSDEESNLLCCQLDLKADLPRWHRTSSSVRPERRLLSPEGSRGCIVDNVLFHYGRNKDEPVIFAHDVGKASQQWVIRGLDKVFEGKSPPYAYFLSLNHITNLRFCLLMHYRAGPSLLTVAMYCLVFDLDKEYEEGEHRRIKDHSKSKERKAEKFNFLLKPVCDRVFQLPNCLWLEFCNKLDF